MKTYCQNVESFFVCLFALFCVSVSSVLVVSTFPLFRTAGYSSPPVILSLHTPFVTAAKMSITVTEAVMSVTVTEAVMSVTVTEAVMSVTVTEAVMSVTVTEAVKSVTVTEAVKSVTVTTAVILVTVTAAVMSVTVTAAVMLVTVTTAVMLVTVTPPLMWGSGARHGNSLCRCGLNSPNQKKTCGSRWSIFTQMLLQILQ